MTDLELSTDTAPTARAHIPVVEPLPSATLSTGRAAEALAAFQSREHSLIDASTTSLSTHLASIATFADTVTSIDAGVAALLGGVRP